MNSEKPSNESEKEIAEDALDMLPPMLEHKGGTYSETVALLENGEFDPINRTDGSPRYLMFYTPQELYKLAYAVEQKYPEYHFTFETDPYGQWMKYTVTREASKN